MIQNINDDGNFFSANEQMSRSKRGGEPAEEQQILKALIPELTNKSVLDLGCGDGMYCRYAREQQASSVIGVDTSEKMLQKARKKTDDPFISYSNMAIEDIHFSASQFDVVISSLTFHYTKSFQTISNKIYDYLKPGGTFIFSVEHPIFTARNEQDWYFDDQGNRLYWPTDSNRSKGVYANTKNVVKYHRTILTYINALIVAGFSIKTVKEPLPSDGILKSISNMNERSGKPRFLLISAEKKNGSFY
ncbi:class I SAM-dependent methyltransferase [Lysinibacillus cavernae]|uniref:class I SAM-dependent methyltransferase n=1 Tax=Lysinibacillus cavernae TaxID=2666135 RepID=UPI0012D9109F|nr:class I SAM-dependent methyltransferase [Lysinibacillus cavernae]